MQAIYDEYYSLLKEGAYREEDGRTFIWNDADFDASIIRLKEHVQNRHDLVNKYLKESN